MVGVRARKHAPHTTTYSRAVTRTLLLCMLTLASVARINVTIPDEGQGRDAGGYVALAENLVSFGVFGTGEEKSMEAAPLLSGAIAVGLRLDPRHADFRETGLVTNHRAVRQVNLVFVALLLAASAVSAVLVLGAGWSGFGAAALTIIMTHLFLLENPEFSHGSLQELPTATALGWTNVAALWATRTGTRPRWLAAVGIAGGVLALSRAVFLYLFPVYLVLLVSIIGCTGRKGPLWQARGVTAGLLGFSLIAGPWIVRNAVEFRELGIADQGGKILLIRDFKNDMTPYQHRGAWVHFSPEPVRPFVGRVLDVDSADFLDDGPLRPLVRYIEDPLTGDDLDSIQRQSFKRQASDVHDNFVNAEIASGATIPEARIAADLAAVALVRENLRASPLRFLRTTPVFLYRSAWPMNGTQIWDPVGFSTPRLAMGIINPIGFVGVISLAFVGLFRCRSRWFALGGLATGMVLFHGLLTHALPRYTRPIAGLMLLVIALAVVEGARRGTRMLCSVRHPAVEPPSSLK